MAAELPPADAAQIPVDPLSVVATTEPCLERPPPPPSPPPPDHGNNTIAGAAATNPPKRQRRPSVRLGEIGGDPPYDAYQRRPNNRGWRFHKDPPFASKTSRTRPLTNLVNGGGGGSEDSENYADLGHRKPKIKKPTKRARTNWNKLDSDAVNNGGGGGMSGAIESANFLQEENENNDEEFRELEPENSESPLQKDHQSPANSTENMGLQYWDQYRRGHRARVTESNGLHHNDEIDFPERQNEESLGVREWLIRLGLERYAPVFEIHEVDDEVLPMLTLEDLKDMGINAVGSRRKMYSAILKLRKGIP